MKDQLQFNHCIGAIDEKHINIIAPDNAGSEYFNYKNHHSIVLLAICDANYCFTLVDNGAYGRRSDGGIFVDSAMGRKFVQGEMNIPRPEPLADEGPNFPYVLVGDEAFLLSYFLLQPYFGRGGLDQGERIYNYRLSRDRRVIENAFGIMVAQWRILSKTMDNTVKNVENIIKAIVCLHSWLRKRDDAEDYVPEDLVDQYNPDGSLIPGRWRCLMEQSSVQDVCTHTNHNNTRAAAALRDQFQEYFLGEGAVQWQNNWWRRKPWLVNLYSYENSHIITGVIAEIIYDALSSRSCVFCKK